MSCAVEIPTLHLSPEAARRRGRRLAASDPRQRDRHIECARLVMLSDWPVKRVAASLGISRATAYLWTRLAMTYQDPAADELREILAGRRGN